MVSFEEKNRDGDIHIFCQLYHRHAILEKGLVTAGVIPISVCFMGNSRKALAQQADVSLFHTHKQTRQLFMDAFLTLSI